MQLLLELIFSHPLALMVVLIILGLAIASTSISNRKLSDKKTKWLVSYYELSGDAEIKISEINAVLMQAKKSATSNENFKKYIEDVLKPLDVKAAMPYGSNSLGDCNISFEIREESSLFNKRIFVNMIVPLDLNYEGELYQISNYQLIQEPLVKEELDEYREDPFENMN